MQSQFPGTHLVLGKNFIRHFVEKQIATAKPTSTLPLVNLSIGDPTKFQFKPSAHILKIAAQGLGLHNGYTEEVGMLSCRKYLSRIYSNKFHTLTENDVFMTMGGTFALLLSLLSLTDQGDNFLIPKPGFPLMRSFAVNFKCQARAYDLIQGSWEIDFESLQKKIDDKTRFVLVNDPSNPCGSELSVQQKLKLIQICQKHKLPIVADQIYEDMLFQGKFVSYAQLTETVPILRCSGLTKKYCVPGWRVGWLIAYAKNGAFDQVKQGIQNWLQIFLMPNTVIQSKLQEIMEQPNQPTRLKNMMSVIHQNAQKLKKGFADHPVIRANSVQGALYSTLSFDLSKTNLKTIGQLAVQLYKEEKVIAFPGDLFEGGNFLRLVICEVKQEVVTRVRRFIDARLKQ